MSSLPYQALDADDESLVKYKQQLLGQAAAVVGQSVCLSIKHMCAVSQFIYHTPIDLDGCVAQKLIGPFDTPCYAEFSETMNS